MNRCLLLATMVPLFLQPLFASDDTAKQQEAIKKIEQAVANTNIFDLPSFQMKANLRIESHGKFLDGSRDLQRQTSRSGDRPAGQLLAATLDVSSLAQDDLWTQSLRPGFSTARPARSSWLKLPSPVL